MWGNFNNSYGKFLIFKKYSPNILENFQFLGNIPQKYIEENSHFLGNIPQSIWGKYFPKYVEVNLPKYFGENSQILV